MCLLLSLFGPVNGHLLCVSAKYLPAIIYRTARSSSFRSVRNMCPGAWVIISGGFDAIATACGVTPQAQNTGTSDELCGDQASPKSGFMGSDTPIPSGLPTCTGAPCVLGNLVVACTALTTFSWGIQRIDTTIGPEKGPAGAVCTFVRNIATFLSVSQCGSVIPFSIRACSNEKLHPRRKLTRSSLQTDFRSYNSSVITPSLYTR